MSQDVTLAVLAGGLGSRMGQPKAELTIGGKRILEFLFDQFIWTGPTVLVTAPDRHHPPGHELFHDEFSDPLPEMGPLGGILTALNHLSNQWVLFTTVDMPGIAAEQLAWLIGLREKLGVFIHDGERIQPFPCIIHRDARQLIESRYAAGERSVKALAELPGFHTLPAPLHWPRRVWHNLNTPQDLQDWL